MSKQLLVVVFLISSLSGIAQTEHDSMFTISDRLDLKTMNDTNRFGPHFKTEWPTKYRFSISSKSGELVFQTEIPQQGWNGLLYNRQGVCNAGVYMWTLSFKLNDTAEHVHTGFMTLLNTESKVNIIGIDTIQCRPELYVPNVMTPNGDGRNDLFMPVFGCRPTEYVFMVYDRWGELIFETKDPAVGWDGTSHGNPVESGVFVYMVEWRFYAGDDLHELSGHVTVIR